MNKKFFSRLLAVVMVLISVFAMVPAVHAEDDTETLSGWTLGEGYSVTSQWVYEGSYALEHTGSSSVATSEAIALEKDITYFVELAARAPEADSEVTVEFAGQTLKTEGTGTWENLSVIVLGDGSDEKITVTATGTAQIDGIAIRPFKEGENLLANGDFASSSGLPYSGEYMSEYDGASGVLKVPAAGAVVRGTNSVSVENGAYYLVSIDVYMEENPPWAYIDMDDRAGEVQLRGTKIGEWHNVSAVWQANAASVPLRLVVENNWDNPNSGKTGTGTVYFDEISIKKVTLYDDLVSDEGFEEYYGGEDKYEWVTVNDNDPSISYGDNTTYKNNEDSSGAHPYVNNDSHNVRGYAQFTFTGNQFSIIAAKSLDCAAFDIYLDGSATSLARVDLASEVWITEEVYVSDELTMGEHTVKIVPALLNEEVTYPNEHYGKYTFTRENCAIDAFSYKREKTTTTEWVTVNATNETFTSDPGTICELENSSDPAKPYYIGGDSLKINEWAEFKFTGTQFTIIGSCSLDCAAFDVYIDGATTSAARVDLARSPWQTAEVYTSEVLENKEHTVRLVSALRGEQSPYGHVRNHCGIDAFKYEKVIENAPQKPINKTWEMGAGASLQKDSYKLYGNNALKLHGNAVATANKGETITVEPNCYYFYSAWRLRPQNDKNVDGVIAIKSADGSQTLASITGTRYNQTMWNPADGTNNAERQTAHWEQIYGFWFSGDNTEIKLCAESTGTGTIYFDNVTFNKFENRAAQKSVFENGDMEGYIPDAIDLLPTTQEKTRVKEQYESFLADDLKNFPTSFKVDGKSYYGFGEDFTLSSQTTEDVIREAISDEPVGKKTISKLTHTSGLVFTVESVLYEEYNAYDWTLYAQQPENANGNSPVISDWNAVDYIWEGETPRLTGTIGDHSAYQPYIDYVEGRVYKTSGSGRGTSGDSSYFNFQYGDKGIMMAVGWPGYWELELNNSEDANLTKMTAGQVELNTYLKPGEEIRTPLMAFVHYNGRNEDRCTNLWRAWMIDCNVNTITPDAEGQEKEVLPAAGIYAATSIQWHEMTRATTENQKTAISYYLDNNVDLTYWWMDAGWYYRLVNGQLTTLNDWGWTDTGVWIADGERFGCDHDGEQHGPMYDISAYAEQNGIRTLLWFEPERIANQGMLVDDATDRVHYSDNTTIHPSWALPGGSWPIMDMGNEDAVDWMLNRILKVMKEGGIDMYREDFNTDPLPNWRAADSAKDASGNRKGITENLYIQGHLGMWDSILEAVPNATIDSCASGGNRNDLESMRRGVPLHKTDHAYGDQTWQQNSAAYFQKWVPYLGTKANGESEANDNTTTANRYALRTALVGGMVLGYNTDSVNAPVDWDIIEDITEEHKDIMHLLYSDYYVHEDWSASGNDWSAWQYFDQDLEEGYLITFRRENASATRTYYLKGLDKTTEYKIWFEDANKPVVRTGIDLMRNGVEVTVPVKGGSDILHIQKATEADADRALTSIISEVSINGQYCGAVKEYADYTRFDIHFNMNLRDTVLSSGTVEAKVQDDYADLITIDGKTVAELNAQDEDAVYMDYDAFNNILNIYVKNALFDTAKDHKVVLSKDIETDGKATIEGNTPWTYSAAEGEWTKGNVTDGLVKTLEIEGDTTMLIGETQTLTVKVGPETAENKEVIWSSSDESVATVDENGKVTAKGEGTVTITATTTDGTRISAEISVTVSPVPVDSITVDGDDEMVIGDEQTLTATVKPDNATYNKVIWSSSDEDIATVDENGKVTAKDEGEVTIFATSEKDDTVFGEIIIEVSKKDDTSKPEDETKPEDTKPGDDNNDDGEITVPEDGNGDDGEATVPEDDKKPEDNKDKAPATGDAMNIILIVAVTVVAAVAIVVAIILKKRNSTAE